MYLCYTRFFSAELNLDDTILQYVSIKNNKHEIKCIKPNQINIQQHKYFGIDKIILVLNMHFDIRFNICGSQSTLSIYSIFIIQHPVLFQSNTRSKIHGISISWLDSRQLVIETRTNSPFMCV